MQRIIILFMLILALGGCASTRNASQLQRGKSLFASGLYKPAMERLLPLAADGDKSAQYAVGYMYYYGYGVAQDTQTGEFWIKRSAAQHFAPAKEALKVMRQQKNTPAIRQNLF